MKIIPVPFRFAILIAILALSIPVSRGNTMEIVQFFCGVIVGLKFLLSYALYRQDRETKLRARIRELKKGSTKVHDVVNAVTGTVMRYNPKTKMISPKS